MQWKMDAARGKKNFPEPESELEEDVNNNNNLPPPPPKVVQSWVGIRMCGKRAISHGGVDNVQQHTAAGENHKENEERCYVPLN